MDYALCSIPRAPIPAILGGDTRACEPGPRRDLPGGDCVMEKPLRLLIADDRPRSRDGMRALLNTWPGILVVGETGGGREAVRLTEELAADVVLMDIRMPGMDGIEATRAIKSRWPEVRVVAVTLYEEYRPAALAAGVDAFIVKGCPPDELVRAIRGGDE